jgi:hypothetical protein
MSASPEAFREVDGSRIAAVSVFLPKPCDHRASPAPQLLHRQAMADRFGFRMNSLVQNNGVTAICCPRSDAALFN